MKYISSLLSFLFILGSIIPIFWGIYITRINLKSNKNKLFFLICLALSIWSFGFAAANLSTSLKDALFWRRFASIGMTSIFSIILQFLLLFTSKKESEKINKKSYIVYIPGIICMYVFSISSDFAAAQYDLVKTSYGVINIAPNNIWDYFYFFYYSLYMLFGLVIIWNLKDRIKEKVKLKLANIIIATILAAAVFGSLTDVFSSLLISKPLPELAPLFMLMPLGTMYYSARYYGFMNLNESYKDEVILNEEDRSKIFRNLSIAFYTAAVLSFISEYIPYMNEQHSFKLAFLKSLSLISIGVIISIAQNIKNESIKNYLTILSLILSIPLITLQYLKYSSTTVWAFPLVIIISSIIFSKPTLIILTALVSVITQVLIWGFNPEMIVVIDRFDFMLRIGMFIVALFTGLYINKMYVNKIKKNKNQIKFQKMNSDILFEFVNSTEENFDNKIDYLLRQIGEFFNVDRTYLFKINHNKNTMTYSNEWCGEGIEKEIGTIEDVPLDLFPWWVGQLKKKQLVYIEDVNFMPEEAKAEQQQLKRQKIKSLVSVPVMGEDKIQAFIGIDSVLTKKEWSDEMIEMLHIMAKILYGGIMKIKADKEIKFMAHYDHLTKLPNRFLFEDRVNQAINLSKRTGNYISIIFLDLDNFKKVNDTIGHMGGDELLKKVAKKLNEVIRDTDTVARFGGDEFIIMSNNITDYKMVTNIADKIMKIFSNLFIVNGQEFLITASAGIAVYPLDGKNSDNLVKNADIAMYEAKNKGKNRYVLCTKEIKTEMKTNLELSKDLNRALERKEFVIYYQPQIDLVTNKIIGVEALLRWIHPERGVISPEIFIPIAEESSLINNIGEWVLKTACIQNKKWQDMGLNHVVVAVNISAVQIMDPKIVDKIENIIKETGLDPKYLELEITENIAIKEENYVIDILNKLKKIGVSIAIDDFGIEYSSLNRLKNLPIDQIKIDMQFIQGIENSEKDRAITMIIINLAKSLKLHVLAEGVETIPQLKFLNEKMCNYAQGYYYYKPMSVEKMEEILQKL